MRVFCILVCLLGLHGCERDAYTTPDEATPVVAEGTAPAPESADPAAAEPSPAPAPEASEPTADAHAATALEVPHAPVDVSSPPADAKRGELGLAWVQLAKGKGKRRARYVDTVSFHYSGWLPSGRMFDNSERFGKPIEVRPTLLIPGLSESVRTMAVGEKRRVWVPAQLAYGELDSGNQTAPRQPLGDLVFDIELIGIKKAPPLPAAPKDVGAIPSDATVSDSGLAWRVLEQGFGSDKPASTGVVDAEYTMWTPDGEVIDSSALRGGVDRLGIPRLLAGWREGMQLMVPGERRIFWLPENLAYQGAPLLPRGTIVIDVKLISFDPTLHQVR